MAECHRASLRLSRASACRSRAGIAPAGRRRLVRCLRLTRKPILNRLLRFRQSFSLSFSLSLSLSLSRRRNLAGGLLLPLLLLLCCRWASAHDEHAKPPHLPFYVATMGAQTIYVLGTLHAGDPADYPAYQPFRAPIINALTASPTLAFELSPDDIVMAPGSVNQYGVCAHDCLPHMLPAALWRSLAHRLRHNPAALVQIRRMKPWLASLLIETFSSSSAGLQTEYGTEAQLENVYLRGPILGLESMDDQMRAFTRLSLPEQWEMLAQDLQQSPAEDMADVRELHALWQAGDADKMAAWQVRKSAKLAQSMDLSNAIDEQILYRRNRRFVVKMLLIVTPNHPLFVAVGALHLGGPRGVLALLRGYGFSVKPM